MVDALCAALEAERPARANPALAAGGKASYAELKAFVADRPGHDRRYAIDASKIRRELGWAPRHPFERRAARDRALVPRPPRLVRGGAGRQVRPRAAGARPALSPSVIIPGRCASCRPSCRACTLIEPDVHQDARGFFLETWHQRKYAEAGIRGPFVQDNHSHSARGTLRGLHAQLRRPQGKLVRAVEGEMFDVAVDIRRGSPSFGRWVGFVLSGSNFRQLWIPPGFAHGFCVLSERVHVEYKCTEFYDREDELAIAWNDPAIGIQWPIAAPVLSAKDAAAPRLAAVVSSLPAFAP